MDFEYFKKIYSRSQNNSRRLLWPLVLLLTLIWWLCCVQNLVVSNIPFSLIFYVWCYINFSFHSFLPIVQRKSGDDWLRSFGNTYDTRSGMCGRYRGHELVWDFVFVKIRQSRRLSSTVRAVERRKIPTISRPHFFPGRVSSHNSAAHSWRNLYSVGAFHGSIFIFIQSVLGWTGLDGWLAGWMARSFGHWHTSELDLK